MEDPKTKLQEHLQAARMPAAEYVIIKEKGPEHRKTFQVEVKVGRRKLGKASGTTKKKAELQAAQAALSKLMDETD